MELWIRSQDKMKLVNNCNLYISNEIRNECVIEDLNNKYLKLGTYKTKERALEVLNEIQNIICGETSSNLLFNENGIDFKTIGQNKIFYQMPEK